jgi:c-di-GMP-binding flagellar brake protein YcgR
MAFKCRTLKVKQCGKIEISLVMKGTTQYCLLREDQILRIVAVTQLRISSFQSSIKKYKGEKKKLILSAVLFRYEMWSFKLKEESRSGGCKKILRSRIFEPERDEVLRD